MIILLIYYLIYLYFLYGIYNKAKKNKLELQILKENICRTIFIQVCFSVLGLIHGQFSIKQFLYRLLFSLIAFTLYPIVKQFLNQIIIF